MKHILFPLMLLLIIIGCTKEKNKINSEYFLSQDDYTFGNNAPTEEKLPVSLSKLKHFVGENIIPIHFKLVNLDNEINNELIICYSENKESDIKIVIFDVLPNEGLKKLYELQTKIRKTQEFSLQITNLFFEDDSCIMIEGVSFEDKRMLYIINNNNGKTFDLIGDFSATYSILFNFEEKETESNKFYIIRDINIIDSGLSVTNANIQKKDVYSWDYSSEKFELVESSQIVSNAISNIPAGVLYSPESYYDYIEGFWYPEKYKKIIENNTLDPEIFAKDSIEYVCLSDTDGSKEININHGDYADRYLINKIVNLGGQKPGLRFTLKDFTDSNNINYQFVDLFLYDSNILKLKGPEDFDFVTYVRLPKPFIEFVQEKKDQNSLDSEIEFRKNIAGSYSCFDYSINFSETGDFEVIKGQKKESGTFKIENKDDADLLQLFFKEENTIIKEKYFIINLGNKNRIMLIPIKLNVRGYIIKNVKSLILIRG